MEGLAVTGDPVILVEGLGKRFVLHGQGGTTLPVLDGASLAVRAGECVALTGPSGSGKSTLMRLIQGNYRASAGSIRIAGTEIVDAHPRVVLALRRTTLGHVSQFLRVVPRVPAIDIVAEPLTATGLPAAEARARAGAMLARLNLPERLWSLSPTTFSGGEQQRVNIARGFVRDYPALLLDEPTASLDPVNREAVLVLIEEARARGAAILGIFHDAEARARVCDRAVDVAAFTPRAAA
jgi:alpha-D-ribose 1-methylphosphonate 5-triphosphate synthase subunit PhnL